MGQIHHIKLPDDVNPHGLVTIKKASELTGITVTTFYDLRQNPNLGLRFYQIRKGGRLYLKTNELLRWINGHLKIA